MAWWFANLQCNGVLICALDMIPPQLSHNHFLQFDSGFFCSEANVSHEKLVNHCCSHLMQEFSASGHCRGATASASLCAGQQKQLNWAGKFNEWKLKMMGSPSSGINFHNC